MQTPAQPRLLGICRDRKGRPLFLLLPTGARAGMAVHLKGLGYAALTEVAQLSDAQLRLFQRLARYLPGAEADALLTPVWRKS